mmetsp:Transcript_5066/g.9087  ORF Transcript_5066/g.9087 Transcript_5066/m.9087 type:complete len:919 (+) Transcript_5066:104-2860(+)|eukprot:CAMPEP_0197626602 /NCGR_PEP_ID=MMETSP1338-20131121/5490_1 /TAXON_ID=43686 ORGANISM="Pelagodinium beii, Strain RCC1491" /NCGR_SAMPLE_ID=MMETSP1338 /ASSEMBLY_ACC=CAM_ASM_000754 /LENGTH=918 /DNA_ID=CAMNT_0043197145 /DNA_START=104 /DNA_END=2860 /DNA_ORIENTATION=-
MASEDRGAAGNGRAAAAYLQMEGSTPSASSTAPAQLSPQPPEGPSTGRPHRKSGGDAQDSSGEWLRFFESLANKSGSNGALAECADLALEVEQKVLQLKELSLKAGLDVQVMSSALSKKLFDSSAMSNPQDGVATASEKAHKLKGRASVKLSALSEQNSSLKGVSAGDLAEGEDPAAANEVEGDIMTSKYAFVMGANDQREKKRASQFQQGSVMDMKHKLHDVLVEGSGKDLAAIKEVLKDPKMDLQAPLHEVLLLPSALIYAVGQLRSPGIVKILLAAKADPDVRLTICDDFEFIPKGQNLAQAVARCNLQEDTRLQSILDLLQAAAEQRPLLARSMSCPAKIELPVKMDEDGSQPVGRKSLLDRLAIAEQVEAKAREDAAAERKMHRRHTVHRLHNGLGLQGTERDDPVPVSPMLFFCKHLDGSPKEVYNLDDIVGSGTFGSVRKAKHKKTGQTHAVKSVPKNLIPPTELWAEIKIMQQLDHPHVMRLHHTFEDDLCIYIASEICEGGELFDALIKEGVLSEHTASALFRQVMSAVAYLHKNGICHRDLKPENFLLAKKCGPDLPLKEGKVKLIDFGTAKRFDLGQMTTKVCTVHYVAPEVLKKSLEAYTEKVDVWSCGVILYLMLAGAPPFNSDNELELMKSVKKGKWSFKPAKLWKGVSDNAKELISSMLSKEVDERLTAEQVQRNDWCNSEDLNANAHIDESTLSQMRTFVAQNRLKKVALQIIARQVSDDTIEKLRGLFLSVDTDNSGSLTVQEMDEALIKLECSTSIRTEMRRLMHEIDVDGNGTINYTEFIAATISKQQYLQEEVCRAAFNIFDVDGDGFISKEDLVSLLHSGEESGFAGINVDEINDIMEEVDANGDNKMSFDEFMDLMSQSGGLAVAAAGEHGGHHVSPGQSLKKQKTNVRVSMLAHD